MEEEIIYLPDLVLMWEIQSIGKKVFLLYKVGVSLYNWQDFKMLLLGRTAILPYIYE